MVIHNTTMAFMQALWSVFLRSGCIFLDVYQEACIVCTSRILFEVSGLLCPVGSRRLPRDLAVLQYCSMLKSSSYPTALQSPDICIMREVIHPGFATLTLNLWSLLAYILCGRRWEIENNEWYSCSETEKRVTVGLTGIGINWDTWLVTQQLPSQFLS